MRKILSIEITAAQRLDAGIVLPYLHLKMIIELQMDRDQITKDHVTGLIYTVSAAILSSPSTKLEIWLIRAEVNGALSSVVGRWRGALRLSSSKNSFL